MYIEGLCGTAYSREESSNFIALSVERVKEIIASNKKGEKIKVENEAAKEGTKSTKRQPRF